MWYYEYYYDIKETIDDIVDNIIYVVKVPIRLVTKIRMNYIQD